MDREEIEALFRRLFRGGEIRRLPKSQREADAFLALVAAWLDPRETYPEQALNERLCEWLEGVTCPVAMDHVTVRRYLVDFNFLIRDESGSRYRANQAVINRMIEPEARSVQPRQILVEVEQERSARKASSKA